jgi:hypothetical protein
VQQVQLVKHESVDYVPAKIVVVELDKIFTSLPNPLNQCVQIELERRTVFILEINTAVSKFVRSFTRVMKNQNLSGRVAHNHWDPTFFAFVRFDFAKHFAITFSVETQDSPSHQLTARRFWGLQH